MSQNPFSANPEVRERIEFLSTRHGEAISAAISEALETGPDAHARNAGATLDAESTRAIQSRFELKDVRELMLLALGVAARLARPPVSGFHVGAVGLEQETGTLVFGGNVEFPGTHLGTTIHGEGFVAARVFSRGATLQTIALSEAHPCAHCRQFLAEFSSASDLQLIDPLGHRLTLAELYPWPFDPAYLGSPGASPQTEDAAELRIDGDAPGDDMAGLLLEAGKRAHTPYSQCPGAVVVEMRDGNLFTGAVIESVAFNPTMPPLQAAIIDLLAHGYAVSNIKRVSLGTFVNADVNYEASTRELLHAVAPGAALEAFAWSRA